MSCTNHFSSTKPTKILTSFPSNTSFTHTSQFISFNRRNLSSPISITSPSLSYPQPQPQPQPQPPFNVEYLESEFGSHGVSFKELGVSYVIKMVMENGSAASILMPSGVITSYKPKMWHGSSVEVLHTCVSERENGRGGAPIVQGGVSLALDCVADDDVGGFSWSPTSWVLNDVQGSSQDAIQVEMMSRNSERSVEVKHNITLKHDTLSSEISVSNLKSSSQLKLKGCILSHLAVSTPDATYAFGLEGSDFFNRQPLISNFSIIPPNLAKKKEIFPSFKRFFPDEREAEEEAIAGEEDDNYKHLTEKMSRIYKSAPRNFTIIDRGKRNSVVIGRKGFEEVYIYSPGSKHECYGKYAYICVGQSAILKPIILGPQQSWRAQQRLHNPNV